MTDEDRHVQCSLHGKRDATYVCQHLSPDGIVVGFHYGTDEENPDALWPDAWCDACEDAQAAEGGWNERSEAFARIKLICDACYEAARSRHWRQDQAAFEALVQESMTYLQSRQDRLFAEYDLGGYGRYDWDQETGVLSFSRDGHVHLVADFQMVGSTSTISNTWLWSWANPSTDELVKHRVRKVRAFGEDQRYLKLASARWPAEEVDGWEMTAIAARLLNAVGAYRTRDEHGCQFLVMTNIRRVHETR